MKTQKLTFAAMFIPCGIDPFTKKVPMYGYFSHYVPFSIDCAVKDRIFEEALLLIREIHKDEIGINNYIPSIKTIKDFSPYNGKNAWVMSLSLDGVTGDPKRVNLATATIVAEDTIGFRVIDVTTSFTTWESADI